MQAYGPRPDSNGRYKVYLPPDATDDQILAAAYVRACNSDGVTDTFDEWVEKLDILEHTSHD